MSNAQNYIACLESGLLSIGFELKKVDKGKHQVTEIHRGGQVVKVGGMKLALPTVVGEYKLFNPIIDTIPLNGVISGNALLVYGAFVEWCENYSNKDPVIQSMIKRSKFSNGLDNGLNQDFVIKHQMTTMPNELKQWLRRCGYKVRDDGKIIRPLPGNTINVVEELFRFIRILQLWLNEITTDEITETLWSEWIKTLKNMYGSNDLNSHTQRIKSQVYKPINIKMMTDTQPKPQPTPSQQITYAQPQQVHQHPQQPAYGQQPVYTQQQPYPQQPYPQQPYQQGGIQPPPPGFQYNPHTPPWEAAYIPQQPQSAVYQIAANRLI